MQQIMTTGQVVHALRGEFAVSDRTIQRVLAERPEIMPARIGRCHLWTPSHVRKLRAALLKRPIRRRAVRAPASS